MEKVENSLLVIFGASGDLTRRKLIPALFDLYQKELLPESFAVLGVSRTKHDDASFRADLLNGLRIFCKNESIDSEGCQQFIKLLYYQALDPSQGFQYKELDKRLSSLHRTLSTRGNTLYYLSTPPSLYSPIVQNLGLYGMNKQGPAKGWKRIIVEKPFGYDLESAQLLNVELQKIFEEDQIYRIDHYLGKETVQNTLAFRFANGIFEPLWNRNYISRVEVTAAEHIGVENRGGYYEDSGALRDMVQNHLLQIVGLIAMESPPAYNADSVRNETVKVFQSLRAFRTEDIPKQVIRAQYTASQIKGEPVKGYREEENVKSDSRTETFVAMKFFIDNWRWGGVPFYIRTGKQLPTRVTEIVIYFRQTPHRLFKGTESGYSNRNQLIIRIQPDEGILLKFGMKMPGAGFDVREVGMDFRYSNLSNIELPDAYERLLLDCLLGDATLYARADAVNACWHFINPVLESWKFDSDNKIYGYPAGTWGPPESHELFENPGEDWRYPCKNLVHDGVYCEL